MPIKKCQSKGKSGHKYGSSGKCYVGAGSLEKAQKQAVAIKISQGKIKPKTVKPQKAKSKSTKRGR